MTGRGTLFVVATPIGNLGDITLRALETLRAVPLIAAEDTRLTRRLLDRHAIDAPLTSFHAICKFSPMSVSRTPSQKTRATRSTMNVYSVKPWPLSFNAACVSRCNKLLM